MIRLMLQQQLTAKINIYSKIQVRLPLYRLSEGMVTIVPLADFILRNDGVCFVPQAAFTYPDAVCAST